MSRSRRHAPRPDPRQVGGTYFCGYWRQEYTVLEIHPSVPVWGVQWTIRWADGHTATHSTAWDWRTDRIVSQP